MRYDANLAYIGRSGPPGWSVLDEQYWPPQYIFWKRWSDEGFQTRDLHWPWPSHIEPPQSTPGSMTVMLDTHDRLVALSIIPVPSLPSPTEKHALDVKDLFERAGLDINDLERPGHHRRTATGSRSGPDKGRRNPVMASPFKWAGITTDWFTS